MQAEAPPTNLALWLRRLMQGPVTSQGDYFDRLRGVVEASAPLCGSCG